MRRGNVSRRGFLEQTMGGMAAAGLPLWFARGVLADEREKAEKRKAAGANDRIVMGAIGTGGRGTGIMKEAQKKGAKIVAVCDVDKARRDKVAKEIGDDCQAYNDFRELLARDDIDAVTIGTPDHWHALIAIAAMKAGKDIYCEKPMTLTVAEGQAMVRTARARDTVFQVGSQQRSDKRFRLACELVRNGRIGKIKTVETRIGDNPKKGPFETAPVPEGLDWDFWLGQTPWVEYVKDRCHYEFRWWYEYSGGKVTDWGAHHNDIAQWGLGADETGPVEVSSRVLEEAMKDPNCYNCPPHFEITYGYACGANVICMSEGENGVKFEGEDGWIFVSRSKIEASDPKLIDEPLPSDATRLYVSDDHMGNFLDCFRDRQKPICPVEVGHRSVSVCHLGNISLRMGGQHLKWDPARERFEGDALANAMLSRQMRSPWKLDA